MFDMCTRKAHSRGVESPASDDVGALALAMGIDPATLPDPKTKSLSARERERETASEYLDRIINEHARRALTDAEAVLLANAMWRRAHGDNVKRAREAYRFILFLLIYGIKQQDVPDHLLPDRMSRTGVSSTIHRWVRGEYFSRAEPILNALPFSDWNETRRSELRRIVEWELKLRAKAEARKADRIFQLATQEGKARR